MRASFCCLWYAILLLTSYTSYSQSAIFTPTKKATEVGTLAKTFFGMRPQVWFEAKGLLTPHLLAEASVLPQNILVLLLTDSVIQTTNHNRYLDAYLLNFSKKPIKVSRSEATVAAELEVLFRLDGQWITPNFLPGTACGNSAWEDTLAASSYFAVRIDDFDFHEGPIPIECKLRMHIGQSVLESAVFMAGLTEDKMYWLRHPFVPLNTTK